MKKTSKISLLLTAALAAVIAFACSDELDYPARPGSGNVITFDCSDGNEWVQHNAATRSGAPESPLTGTGVLKMECSTPNADPLYIHSFTYDGVKKEDAPSDADQAATRASGWEITNDRLFANFNATAFHNDGTSDDKLFFEAQAVEPKSADGLWHFTGTERYWPHNGKLRFACASPYNSNAANIHSNVNGNTVVISHKTPYNSWDQADLCVTVKEADCAAQGTADLKFYHALTRVKFEVGDMLAGQITYINIKNIHTGGTLTLPTEALRFDDENNPQAKPTNIGWVLDETIGDVHRGGDWATPGADITKKYDQVFMLLPQTLPDDAIIEVGFKDQLTSPTQPRILTAKIGGTQWIQGTTKIYKISSSAIEYTPSLEVPKDFEFSYAGGSGQFYVNSTAVKSVYGEVQPDLVQVPWTLQYLDDNDNVINAEWLSGITTSGEGTIASKTFNVDVIYAAGQFEDLRPHTEWIQSQPATFGVVEDISLREKAGLRNTANCYVINHAGSYKFPLVYGNAIKDSKDNPSAYTYTGPATTTNVLNRFVNHVNHGIFSPYIYDASNYDASDVRKPTSTKLIWQDTKGLITSCKLTDNGTFLQFDTATAANITEGNAIIAVLDNKGEIMWSWHIWVTDYIPRTHIAERGHKYDIKEVNAPDIPSYSDYQNLGYGVTSHKQEDIIMGVNLGWCSDYIRHYFPRKTKIRVTQKNGYGTPLTATTVISQTEGLVNLDGNAPFYQFGRKDPLCPIQASKYKGSNSQWKNKILYDINNKTITYNTVAGKQAYNYAIKNPDKFIKVTSQTDWSNESYLNLWSGAISKREDIYHNEIFNDVKTIYDPCPPGYEVPDLFVFTFVTGRDLNDNSSKGNTQSIMYSKFYQAMNSPYHGFQEGNTTDDTPRIKFLENLGYVMYSHQMLGLGIWPDDKTEIFFPAIGVRSYSSGGIAYGNDRGYVWTSTPQFVAFDVSQSQAVTQPQNFASSFGFRGVPELNADGSIKNPVEIMPMVQNTRAGGLCVRPVREKDFEAANKPKFFRRR